MRGLMLRSIPIDAEKVVQAQACCGNVHPIVAGQLHIFSKCQACSLDWASIHVSKNSKDIECILVYIG